VDRILSLGGDPHLVLLLPDGHHRAVHLSATDGAGARPHPSSPSSLPLISVRTLLPLARLLQAMLRAREETADAVPPHPSDATSTRAGFGRSAYKDLPAHGLDPAASELPPTARPAPGEPDAAPAQSPLGGAGERHR
jgi:hypothetical protein